VGTDVRASGLAMRNTGRRPVTTCSQAHTEGVLNLSRRMIHALLKTNYVPFCGLRRMVFQSNRMIRDTGYATRGTRVL